MIINTEHYLTPEQFAKAKGCSLKTVYNFLKAKEDSDGYRILSEEFFGKKVINIGLYKGKLKS